MYKSILQLLLVLISFQGLSQNKSLDSLINLLDNQKKDSNKYNLCLKIAKAYADSAYDKSLLYFNKALDIADRSSDRKKLAHIYHQIGYMYQRKGEFALALTNYNNALTIHEYLQNKKGIGQTLNDIGLIYKTWGKYDKALENYINALQLFDDISDAENGAMVANNIGQIYFYRNEFEKAIEYFKKYLEVNKKINYQRAVAGASNNIGSAYIELKKYDDALKYFTTSMKIYDSLDLRVGVAVIKDNIGSLFLRKNNFTEALRYHTDALKIFEGMGSQSRICNSLLNVGLAYSKLKKPDIAINYLNRSLDLAIKLNQKETQKDVYDALAQVNQEIKQFDKALSYYKLYTQINDSLLNAETIGKIETVQAEYETQKKEKELAEISQKLQAQKKILFLSSGVFLLFIFLLVLILRENSHKKKAIKNAQQKSDILLNTLTRSSNSLIQLVNQKNELSSFLSKYWFIKPTYQPNEDNNFLSFNNDSFISVAFISNNNRNNYAGLINFSVFEFLSTLEHQNFDGSLQDLYTDFISKHSSWNKIFENVNSIRIDFLMVDKTLYRYNYSGLGNAFRIHEGKITKLENCSGWHDISKNDRFFFYVVYNDLVEPFDKERILSVLEKNLSASVNKSFEEQKEILKSSLDLQVNEYRNKVMASIFAFMV